MQMAVAKSVVDRLEDDADVLTASVDRSGRDVSITALVPNKYAKQRVKSGLDQYPLYVDLQVDND